MKKSANLIILLLCLFAFNACGGSDNKKGEEPQVASQLNVTQKSISFLRTANTQIVKINASERPTLTADQSWVSCTVDVDMLDNTLYYARITVTENTDYEDRSAVITVKCGDKQDQIAVSQSQAEGLKIHSFSPDKLGAEGGQVTVSFQATGPYEFETTPYISLSKSRAINDYTETLQVAANTSTSPREHKVVIKLKSDPTVKAEFTIAQEAGEARESRSAAEIAREMYTGINIGNTLEATGGETAWGAPMITRQLIRGYKEAGFKSIRIPCNWEQYMDASGNIKKSWIDRVYEVVGYCLDEDLYVVLNDHWDKGWLENDIPNGYNAQKAERLRQMWTQIAQKMAEYDQRLLFAGLNEPNCDNQTQTNTLMQYEQVFVDAVRATGGNNADRILVVQGPGTDVEKTVKWFKMPTDIVPDHLMLEVHFYTPYNFCLMEEDADWGNTFWFWGKDNHMSGSKHNPTWGEEAQVKELLQSVHTKFPAVPVILGEYAPCLLRSGLNATEMALHKKSRCYWSQYVTSEARNAGMIPFYWDITSYTKDGLYHPAIIDRKTGNVDDKDMLDAIMRGANASTFPF